MFPQERMGRLSQKDSTTGKEALPEGYTPESGMPQSLSLLRWKLGQKAKRERKFRFYALYDRIYRWDVLQTAYRNSRSNGGKAGVDGVSFEQIESSEEGVDGFLKRLQDSLKEKTYRPKPLLRNYIRKENGKLRPLGIPCIADRVAQGAVTLVIEPIFEADFLDCSHGFRPCRDRTGAIRQVQANLEEGRREIYDGDLTSYFDTIEHVELLKKVERRISDGSVLRLIRMWLTSEIEEVDETTGRRTRTRPERGTPQGGVISPLLANIYLHELDQAFEQSPDSPRHFANARLIRYADDFVVMARYMGTRITGWLEGYLEEKLRLQVNREKTRTISLKEEGELTFVGYTLRYDRDRFGRSKRYLNIIPSAKAQKAIRERIKKITSSGRRLPLQDTIEMVNRITLGWKRSYSIGYPREAFRQLNWYVLCRFRTLLRRRSQRRSRPFRQGETLYAGLRRYGLVYL